MSELASHAEFTLTTQAEGEQVNLLMPVLTDAELRMVAEVVTELARFRGTAFDKTSKGTSFARAAMIDPAFKVRLAEVHRRLESRRSADLPLKMLASIAPLFRDLERDAEVVLSGWREPE